tara:strand:+ start:3994 stop:4155 length:162 start_codon:yes stop_codon:yes gene_type:complete
MPYSKYSPKQKKLAAVAEPRKKITRADLIKIAKDKKRNKAIPRRRATRKKSKQ